MIKKNSMQGLYKAALIYPVYVNLNYWWNYGVLAFFCLVIQILSGIFLAMYYVVSSETAFLSIEYIVRDVNFGWFMRYLHSNGASMFFLVVYIHMFRNIYYFCYVRPRGFVWFFGTIILFLMILTAFLGYVLPWGQMSFWAATVITNLCTALPFVGTFIVVWLWGGYAVDNATLNRFFSIHFVLPFVIILVICIHIYFLHETGSSSPLGLGQKNNQELFSKISFYPYYIIKDLLGVQFFLLFFLGLVSFLPNYLSHPDNYIPADPLVTPTHIVPEWYFLPYYAILRSIPNKLVGVIFLFFAILMLFMLPWMYVKFFKETYFRWPLTVIFWFFLGICILLGWIGGEPVEYPYLFIGRTLTFLYFLYFILINYISFVSSMTIHLYRWHKWLLADSTRIWKISSSYLHTFLESPQLHVIFLYPYHVIYQEYSLTFLKKFKLVAAYFIRVIWLNAKLIIPYLIRVIRFNWRRLCIYLNKVIRLNLNNFQIYLKELRDGWKN